MQRIMNKLKQKEPGDEERPKKFTLTEPLLILSIIGLSLWCGMSKIVQNLKITKLLQFTEDDRLSRIINSMPPSLIPVPGIIALAFLSEISGRKPIFITLCAVSVATSIVAVIPAAPAVVVLMTYVLALNVKGGLVMLTMCCIPEYCRTKYRFFCLIIFQIAQKSGLSIVMSLTVLNEVIPMIYFEIYMIVLAVACLGSACVWPESPYWLAARGRSAAAAYTLQKLRGECAEPELSQLTCERRSLGPIKLVYRLFICVLALASVETFTSSLTGILFMWTLIISSPTIIAYVASPCLLILIGIVSYRVKRKIIYLASAVAAIVSGYLVVLWMWLFVESLYLPSVMLPICLIVCLILFESGPGTLVYVGASEIMPQKYNTVFACCYQLAYIISFNVNEFLMDKLKVETFNYIRLVILITMTVPGLIIGYFLAPETKDKTVFEIQKCYTFERTESPEQGQILQNVNTLTDEPHLKRKPVIEDNREKK